MAGGCPGAARSPAATPALAIRQPVTFPGTSQADAGTARATRRRATWPARHASGRLPEQIREYPGSHVRCYRYQKRK